MQAPEALLAGRYRFVKRIQAGAKTIAWLAADTASGVEYVAAALGAARANALEPAAGLTHPHLAALVELVKAPDPGAIPSDGAPVKASAVAIAEYVPGLTLHDQLKAGAVGLSDAVALLSSIASAAAALHGTTAAHGAISPRSIVIAPSKTRPSPILTQLIAPTSGAYSTPERLEGAGPTAEDDVWALFATLHAALTGSVPFEGNSRDELARAMRGGNRTPLIEAGVENATLEALLDWGLATDPKARLVDASELWRELSGWLHARGPIRASLSELVRPSMDWDDEDEPIVHPAPPLAIYEEAPSAPTTAPPVIASPPLAPPSAAQSPPASKPPRSKPAAGADDELPALTSEAPPLGSDPQASLPSFPLEALYARPTHEAQSPESPRPESPRPKASSPAPPRPEPPRPKAASPASPRPESPSPEPPASKPPDSGLAKAAPERAAPATVQEPITPFDDQDPTRVIDTGTDALLAALAKEPTLGRKLMAGAARDAPDETPSAPAAIKTDTALSIAAEPGPRPSSEGKRISAGVWVAIVAVVALLVFIAFFLSDRRSGDRPGAPSTPVVTAAGRASEPATVSGDPTGSPSVVTDERSSGTLAGRTTSALVKSATSSSSVASPAQCVASYFSEGTFQGGEDFAFLCGESDFRGITSQLHRGLVVAGIGKVTPGMKEWATLGWYELAATAVVRAGCCPNAPPIVLPQFGYGKSCSTMRASLEAVSSQPIAPADVTARARAFSANVRCLYMNGVPRPYHYAGHPTGANRHTFEGFLARVAARPR